MILSELVELVPDHSRIAVVLKDNKDRYTTVYSGYKGSFSRFCEHNCIYSNGYEIRTVHAGSWENKTGLIIGVKYA